MAQENFKCPDDYGFYPHHISCDKYWKCDNGAAELKTCGNGLAFDNTDAKYLSENCDYHHNVECGDRTQFGKYEVTVFLHVTNVDYAFITFFLSRAKHVLDARAFPFHRCDAVTLNGGELSFILV